MKHNCCRICNQDCFDNPIFDLDNMPKAAQYLPNTPDEGVDLKIYQCATCGLIQINDNPVPYYKEVIRASAFSEEMKQYRVKQFGEFVKKYNLIEKKVLEIGCGKGEYLELMKNSGADAYGIEFSNKSVEYCQNQNLLVNKYYIDKENANILHAPFNAFFILNFLEHFPDPNSALKGIRNNLVDEGIGLVEVPNFDMMIKHNLFSEFIGDHLLYFTKETLLSTLSRNGFEILECNNIWYDYIISAVVKKRQPLDLSDFYNHKNKVVKELHQYIDQYDPKKVAIYGAGHQALAVIGMSKIGSKIKYVVDDATFKQGKYAPASHVPIVSPDSLENDPVEAIIVMAASYSDEVAKKIKKSPYNSIGISILRQNGLEIHN